MWWSKYGFGVACASSTVILAAVTRWSKPWPEWLAWVGGMAGVWVVVIWGTSLADEQSRRYTAARSRKWRLVRGQTRVDVSVWVDDPAALAGEVTASGGVVAAIRELGWEGRP